MARGKADPLAGTGRLATPGGWLKRMGALYAEHGHG